MLQTIVTIILLIFAAAVVITNPSVFQGSVTLRAPGMPDQVAVITLANLMEAAGAGLVVIWIAGRIDRGGLEGRVTRYERDMRVMNDEVLRMKAHAYDQERQPLEDIRIRLDTLDRDIRGLRARIDREPAAGPADTNRVQIDKTA
jgi:hypothetical protein